MRDADMNRMGFTHHSSQQFTSDGILPVLIAFAPCLVRCCFRHGHVAEVVAAVIAPVLAASLRGAVGICQLESINNGQPGLTRQITFAVGIVLLLLAEVFVSTLQFAQNEQLLSWLLPAGLFCLYMGAMQHAFAAECEEEFVSIEPLTETSTVAM